MSDNGSGVYHGTSMELKAVLWAIYTKFALGEAGQKPGVRVDRHTERTGEVKDADNKTWHMWEGRIIDADEAAWDELRKELDNAVALAHEKVHVRGGNEEEVAPLFYYLQCPKRETISSKSRFAQR